MGFDARADGTEWFAAYTTWHEEETIDWFQFQPMASGTSWGVGYVTFIEPLKAGGSATASASGLDTAPPPSAGGFAGTWTPSITPPLIDYTA
jgi:hypothetical protein